MFHVAGRIIRFSSETVWRNLWLSVITISTITLTLLSISLVVGLQVGIDQIVRATERRIDLSTYIFPTATEAQVKSVIEAIKNLPGVTRVELVTKEEALARYRANARNAPELEAPLKAIGDNPFGPSLTIKANTPGDYQRVIEELNKPQYKDLIEGNKKDYEANQAFIQNFTAFTEKVRYGAVVISGVFALIACLLLANTIRVSIYTHRDEIAVMKLVGATNRFVRTPFLAEAFFYCLMSTALAAGIVFVSLHFGQPYLSASVGLEGVDLYTFFQQQGLYIFGAEFAFIFILSIISSVLAIRKYLRV